MAAEENEAAERPVREQLKKASLAGLPDDAALADADAAKESVEAEVVSKSDDDAVSIGEQRGRLQKKRSFEEVEGEEAPATTSEANRGHTRKRSRDSAAEDEELSNGKRKVSGEKSRNGPEVVTETKADDDAQAAPPIRPETPDQCGEKRTESAVEAMASPKTKRSRLHSMALGEDGTLAAETVSSRASSTADDTNKPAPASTTSSSTDKENIMAKIPPPSGFAITSSAAPVGALAGRKSPPAQTSQSAFKASGFGALAASSNTGFGAVGKSSGGFGTGDTFATGAKGPPPAEGSKDDQKPAPAVGSTFAGALGQQSVFAPAAKGASAFGSSTSSFGKLAETGGFRGGLGGSGFGSLGGGIGLTSFASGKSTPLAGSSHPAKVFGAAAGQEERQDQEGQDVEAGYKSPLSTESDHRDERFYEQELETGEEDETMQYSCRAKLYTFTAPTPGAKKEWRERGLGVLRLNVKHPAGDEKPKARFLMRADGSHRVVLNTPVKKEITFGSPAGGPPQGGYMYFMGTIDGKSSLELLQLKIKQQYALELHEKVVELQTNM